MAGIPFGIAASVALAILIGIPTFRLTGHYFSMATIAVAELIRIYFGTRDLVGAAIGTAGTCYGAWLVGSDLSQRVALLLHLSHRS